jgi:GNAT superfamily N-acetyltransferase
MPATIRHLSAEAIRSLTPRTFDLANLFDTLDRYTPPAGGLLVGEVDGTLAAAAAVHHEADTLQIDHFVVLPRFRGHGLGGKLMRGVIDHARSLKVARIVSQAPAWCPDWRAFYTRHGFAYTDARTAGSLTDMTPVELALR